MAHASPSTTQIQLRLDRLRAGYLAARDELLTIACKRLTRLAQRMLRRYRGVCLWEQTDDVLQSAALRLWQSLDAVKPASVRSFINLAAVQIRRELIDLARHYQGREGPRRLRVGRFRSGSSASPPGPPEPGTDTDDPARLAGWTEFHAQVQALSDAEKEIFDLLWYQGLSKAEAAALLGVTERVVRYRWRCACVRLHHRLGGRLPR
jgi:RNA polymerase sigma-70 factor (ECF subfamily)